MRIFFFLPDVDAGVARVVKNIVRFKPSSNAQYFAVLFSIQENKSPYPIQEIDGVDEVYRITYSANENVYSVYKRMSALLKSGEDIIVANDGFEVRMVAALKLANPLVYIIHGDFNYYYSVCSLNFGIVDLFIAISQKIEKELRTRILPADHQHKIRQIYFPAAIAGSKPSDHRQNNSHLKILFAGTLDTRKGAHLLKEIYDTLSRHVEHFELCIIGDGPLREVLTRQFANCENVLMEGWQSNDYVIQKMKLSDVFLFPSSSEGLPNVLIEALYAGAVPVASRLESGVMDVITDDVNGCLVETGNSEGYANAIVHLNRNRDWLATLSENGKAGLTEKFEPHRQAALYDGAIQGVCKSTNKIYPDYPMGRFLNRPWLPNPLVITLRSLFKNPKL